jgi:nucleotide-binding universal stress UspA family protein
MPASDAVRPVATVGEPDTLVATSETPGMAGRIVVGVDGSASSAAALAWALDEGVVRHQPVHVVLTWMMPAVVGMSPSMLPPHSEVESGARQQLEQIVAAQTTAAGPRPADSVVTLEVVEGSAPSVLVTSAHDASLLVVGSRGHGGFAGLLLGSVSQQCAAHAPCPVVVVRGSANP